MKTTSYFYLLAFFTCHLFFSSLFAAMPINNPTPNTYNVDAINLSPIQVAALYCCSPNVLKKLFSLNKDPQQYHRFIEKNFKFLLHDNSTIENPYFLNAIKTLLTHRIITPIHDEQNNTPLHKAIYNYNISPVKNVSFNPCLDYKQNIPHPYNAIMLLLFAGVNHEKKNKQNKTALDLIHPQKKTSINRLIDLKSFFTISQNLSSYIQIPAVATIILNYLSPIYSHENNQPTEEEKQFWCALAPIRETQHQFAAT